MKVFLLDKYSAIAFLLIAVFTVTLIVGMPPSAPAFSQNGRALPIYSVETPEKAVSVTFDTAWGNEDIDAVIDALANADCKATFFITGEWAEKFPNDVKKLHGAGHEIASHSDSHKHFSSLSEEEMIKDMDTADAKLKNLTGADNILFRAPYGEYNETLVLACRKTDRYIIQWSLDSLDYKGLSTKQMEDRILPKLREGDIILFHTGTDNTAAALGEILGKIKAEGYEFKTVGELIYKDNFTIDHEGRQRM
ncbi:MAG: polysaccharide deacetylase family protein [Clostridia bacterium]|nr:polysaccharide deacetylase family protein [Clostridia bacterium]MBQ7718696.1 polysaccharide deacetylase family protein [Clostridia bacterium]